MNILVITTSLRKNSNSELLADYFIKGAQEQHHNVEKITLKDKKIAFCHGCLACQSLGECIIKDDSNGIVKKMCNADILVFATPIYYYEMSGQMKVLLDRANPLFSLNYSFRKVYLLATAADSDDYAIKRAYSGLEGWVECFEKAKLCGYVFAGGVTRENDIIKHPALQKAYELGKSL